MINDISNTIWGLEILNNDTYLSLDEKITDIHRVRCYLFNTCIIWAVTYQESPWFKNDPYCFRSSSRSFGHVW